MSRHKLVKALDIDDELDDYDGGENYGDDRGDEQISTEDRDMLQSGTIQVRSVLGPDVPVTDTEIEESLWHYYYDVEKTINYILTQKSIKPKTTKKQNRNIATSASTAAEIFKDAPWLNIPGDRFSHILVEPLYPPGRLLGGASTSGGKMSKLAALAAARRKEKSEKDNETPSQKPTASVALLDRLRQNGDRLLSRKSDREINAKAANTEAIIKEKGSSPNDAAPENYVLPSRIKSRASQSHFASVASTGPSSVAPTASPSIFAQTLFSDDAENPWRSDSPKNSLYFKLPPLQGPSAKLCAFSGPSPDDRVVDVQKPKKAKSAKTPQYQSDSSKAINGIAQDVKEIAINNVPKVRNKNLDVVSEFEHSKLKDAVSFVVIGHVDAGKSTLMGRLLYELKMVDKRTLDKYRKEAENIGKSSFALAWVLDQGSEERSRGVTIDFATNKFETEKTSFTILDAPGHQDFIPNMIAGASQADFAVLVIDASIGSFESGLKGQTKEHALLVRSLGVSRMIIAINKLDAVQWSQTRFTEISTQLSAFLTAIGFLSKNITFVPCSGLTGDNIIRKPDAPLLSWYEGPCLLSLLESSEPAVRAIRNPLRLTINDVFRGGVTNPISISGRLDAGSVQLGDQVLVMPATETATVKAIEADSASREWAVAGQLIVLHLSDIEAKYLKPGDVICPITAPVQNISSFTMKVLAFEHVMPMRVEVHRGRLQSPGRISQLMAIFDKASGATIKGRKKVKLLKPGDVARISVEMDEAIPLEVRERVVLRAGGETIAAGLIE